MTRTARLVACLLVAAACNKKDDGAAAPAAKGAPDRPAAGGAAGPARPTADPGPFGAWNQAGVTARLQGAWVLRDVSFLGSVEAWEVKGDKVTVFDGTKEETLELAVEAPCQLTTTKRNPDGSSQGGTSHFVFAGDTLHLGLGDAGVKLGDTVVGCMSNGVYLWKGGTCQFFTEMFDKWDAKEATCSLAGDLFKAANPTFKHEGEMKLAGDVLMSDQLRANPAVKVKDLAEAKARVTELKAAK